MSLAWMALVPVLSPIRQSFGNPAFRRRSPVVLPSSHCCKRWRESGDSTSPSTTFSMLLAIARGVVVSSSGRSARNSFSSGSVRLKPRHAVAELAGKCGQRGRSAETGQDEVGGSCR